VSNSVVCWNVSGATGSWDRKLCLGVSRSLAQSLCRYKRALKLIQGYCSPYLDGYDPWFRILCRKVSGFESWSGNLFLDNSSFFEKSYSV
jgi:hypothetical protein